MKWMKGARKGVVTAARQEGKLSLSQPWDLSYDGQYNLYVIEFELVFIIEEKISKRSVFYKKPPVCATYSCSE